MSGFIFVFFISLPFHPNLYNLKAILYGHHNQYKRTHTYTRAPIQDFKHRYQVTSRSGVKATVEWARKDTRPPEGFTIKTKADKTVVVSSLSKYRLVRRPCRVPCCYWSRDCHKTLEQAFIELLLMEPVTQTINMKLIQNQVKRKLALKLTGLKERVWEVENVSDSETS